MTIKPQAVIAESDAPSPGCRDSALQAAMARACATIMPVWPLDQAVAVNPHWRRIGMPVRRVAARLAVLGDFRLFPDRAYIRQEWEAGRIAREDLDTALKAHATREACPVTAGQCIAGLAVPLRAQREPLLVDLLDDEVQKNRRWPWRAAIVFQLSQMCAAYFDRHQAHWRAAGNPDLFGFWRESTVRDHGLASMLGLPGLARQLHQVPLHAGQAARWAIDELALPDSAWNDYLEALLLSINGWASWCAYVQWQKVPSGQTDLRMQELLVARLVWEAVLARCTDTDRRHAACAALASHWNEIDARIDATAAAMVVDECWQQALEASYQRGLANELLRRAATPLAQAAEAQAVFCIDTRSEAMRRTLESVAPRIETRSFAGFFGIPMHYNLLGTDIHRPQLPGLAYPSIAVQDIVTAPGDSVADDARSARVRVARWKRLARLDQWLGTVRWPSATFSFVEAFGIGYLGKIARWIRPAATRRVSEDRIGLPAKMQLHCRPSITGLDHARRAELAADVLHTMGLDDRLAPLVVLCGHAAQCANNAHASALDCGACYGRPGEANARALAGLLNDARVREDLGLRGLHIPQETVFVAALYNTTTDETTAFDLDLLPAAALVRWKKIERAFAIAGERIRRERAPALRMNADLAPAALLAEFRRRANDGAQVRPEWGLARNASILIAPRTRSRGRMLNRTFLHDYDARFDADGSVLEKLMMGPLLVTNWLSWQYHASTCDPIHYGAGNKVLHNVVDGHVGVFEGNGGDLRIGLPRQSLHDGESWYHQPVRLTVVMDAPAASIERIIARNTLLGQLLDNGWMLLWRYEGAVLKRYELGRWLELEF
jgi:uncharacterized protein YbcC (UPF0753/DUF2309 family)